MGEKITKKEVEELMKIPGNVKGTVILADVEYIRKKAGEEGVKKLEQRLKELEVPFSIREIKPMEKYPEALSVIVILLAKEILGLDDQGVFEMGRAAVKISFFIKLLTKYFVSLKKCFEESPKYWQKHFDFGELETVELNEAEKYAIIRVKGYKFHPIMCQYHKGYFLQIAQLALGKDTVAIEETKCPFRGDAYHEYLISWE